MHTELLEDELQHQEQFIKDSKYFKHTKNYWSTASPLEKQQLQNWYVKNINHGSNTWNNWAQKLERFIEVNNLRRSDFAIYLNGENFSLEATSGYLFPIKIIGSKSNFMGHEELDLSNSKFLDGCEFDNCHFNSNINFSNTTFKGTISFRDTIFNKRVNFQSSRAFYNSHFGNCEFKGSALFTGTTFFKHAYFFNTEYHSLAYFVGTKFSDNTNFSNSTFHEDSFFDDAIFKNSAIFTNVTFEKVSSFQGSRFSNDVPEFNYCKFKQPPSLSKIEIADKSVEINDSITERYRRLKSLAITSHDHEQELKFFSYEMRSKRITSNEPLRTKLPLWLYEFTSNFGRSILRPSCGFLSVLFLSMIINLLLITPTQKCSDGKESYSIGASYTTFISSYSFPFLFSDKDVKRAVNQCLFGKNQPPPAEVHFVGFFQSILSAIFAFLIGLGIRNRFRIK